MNEATNNIMETVASNQVIMVEILIYAIASLVLILLMDAWAAKVIGSKASMEYKILRIPKYVSLTIVCGFTVVVGLLCIYNSEFSVTRATLTYFGLPYFIGVVYFMFKMMRRVRSVQKRRKL